MAEIIPFRKAESSETSRPTKEEILRRVSLIMEKGVDADSLANDIHQLAEGKHDDAARFVKLYPGWTQEDFRMMDEELETALEKRDSA